MMQRRRTVGSDGQVSETAPRTLMDAKTPEERAAIVERLRGLARELRAEYGDDLPSMHADDLYGDDGLPA